MAPLPSNWSGDKFSLKSCWDNQFFWKKKGSSLKILVFLSKCHLEPRLPPKRIKVSFFRKHWKFCVQNLLKSSSYIHFKNTKQFNIHTHKQLTLIKMQQLLLTFITIQMWTLMQRPTTCNMCTQSSVQASMYPQVSETYSHLYLVKQEVSWILPKAPMQQQRQTTHSHVSDSILTST